MKRPPSNRGWVFAFVCVVAGMFAAACEVVSHSSDFQTVTGQTVVGCPTGQDVCGGGDGAVTACVVLATDPANCGACGTSCSSTEICSAGLCVCPNGSTACGDAGACANLTTDPSNCGACGAGCGPESICQASTCTPLCQVGQTNCTGFVADGGAGCVDVTSDTANCGACDAACGTNEICQADKCCDSTTAGCTCDVAAGLTPCGADGCFNLGKTYAHCGACGTSCVSTQQCVDSKCACPAGEILCGGRCLGCAGGSCVADACSCLPGSKANGGVCCAPRDTPSGGMCCPPTEQLNGVATTCCAAGDSFCTLACLKGKNCDNTPGCHPAAACALSSSSGG